MQLNPKISDNGSLRSRREVMQADVDNLQTPYTRPVLMLTGHQDSDVGYRDQWKLLQNYSRATFAVLDGAGHALAIEQAGLFERLTEEWLNRLGAASASATARKLAIGRSLSWPG